MLKNFLGQNEMSLNQQSAQWEDLVITQTTEKLKGFF